MGARWLLMRSINRERPPRQRWLTAPEGASYPSRHATAATLGLLALRRELPSPTPVTSVTVLLIAAECWSRLRLGVHWPTDVIAGVLLALMAEAATDLLEPPSPTTGGVTGDAVQTTTDPGSTHG
jgi:undecaprenyl-diphosphatase